MIADHPAQEHVQSFAGRISIGCRDMFAGAFGGIGQGKKQFMKAGQGWAGMR